ncbi:ATP-binding protein [Roseicyclus marinus]|uniref:ATP-binding protein n=1 Tax=Roseicyclus marinus TaxID=2161673 RepID=UPI00240ED706|nr:biotin carboxylase N-terminal domain-containing protein [Roseicyclus marinus]MDG3040786.1 biotin carboxylase N-terminal domain-containing protein [Roseicyclus marinus]
MFRKILIANRGEIACRVIETCRKMGVGTVAVYSDADAGARHVAMADEAERIGGPKPSDSYLRGDAIIAAARATGAEAIHPGYGFLSENPDFVEAVAAAGLIFIGPSASAIRAMGLKDAAKALMEKAGVPVVPGYHGANQDPEHLAGAAETIGYPVLIKAVAGGGGKGMRRVERAEDFMDALESAKGEAATAFGNAAVLIEKYVEKPRHIEVQVFGDGTRAVHLFERDCSLQRRHQKVIEEAPAPGMTDAMRAAMGQAAVRAAEAIGYAGAGTVEFIVDGSRGLRPDGFWFMEMNTRLQVEHPVTEAITGVDLVEWQLRVAAGAALPCGQEDLAITGHAFEARLYAEDVPKGFLPATGRLTHLRFPEGARADTGVRAGDEISPWYDPMIAKIIVHGPTRDVALRKLEQALARTEVAGSVTNLAFLRRLAGHSDFAAGDVDTGLIARDLEALAAVPVASSRIMAVAALAALGLDAEQGAVSGFTLWAPLRRQVVLDHEGEAVPAVVEVQPGGRFRVEVGDAAHEVLREGARWRIDGAPMSAEVVVTGGEAIVFAGDAHGFEIVDPLAVAAGAGAASGVIEAPMPGLVKAIFVAPGDRVAVGDRLAVLEAMKMEHSLTAGRDGLVAEVPVAVGAQVEAGAALIVLADEEAEGGA